MSSEPIKSAEAGMRVQYFCTEHGVFEGVLIQPAIFGCTVRWDRQITLNGRPYPPARTGLPALKDPTDPTVELV